MILCTAPLSSDHRGGIPSRLFAALAGLLLLLAGQGAHAVNRVALVIGNSSYKEAPLRNPTNDARAMAKTLEELGFEVMTLLDASRDSMQNAILEFSGKLDDDTTGLFYYAGHGIQARGRNYLIPVDAALASERALRYEAIDVSGVLEEMEFAHNRVNVVILDACRNNPFERRFRGRARGLAAIDAARGTLIAYATAPGSVAIDGEGRNGVYTEELLKALRVPGLKAEEVFKRVRVNVSRRTGGLQVPWESSSLTGDIVFRQTVKVEAPKDLPAPARADHEALFWESIEDSDNPALFTAYLKQYPEGAFAPIARIRLEEVEAEQPRLKELDPVPAAPLSGTEPRSTPTFTLAILPFWGRTNWNPYVDWNDETLNDITVMVIEQTPSVSLLFSTFDGGARREITTPLGKIWKSSGIWRKPDAEVVFALGNKLGVDAVLMHYYAVLQPAYTDPSHITLDAYLLDIERREVLHRRGDVVYRDMERTAEELTRAVLSDFLNAGGRVTKK